MSQGNTDVTIQVSAVKECENPDAETACSVLDVLGRVSGKWSVGILLATSQGPVRFTELERQLKGISRRMLTLTLRNLERDGLLTRTVFPTVPPRVEYTATPMARELYDSLVVLAGWAERHVEAIDRARATYDGT
ncbi:helix-turn-helix transcriptional regulator [Streptomyces sp. NBC_01255]|uniref:winged helix-turn-helix transcriptional regulator n=1 Tax=Streptomyces sp. NBC_01255 TaxID=2903798 RepID=UPI002E362900|nr:helix-turn-helix domain-containing protein [Streptomyces sp. NBC_01255]